MTDTSAQGRSTVSRRTVGVRQSDGMKLLSAVVRDAATAVLGQVDARWFTDAERPAYEFINTYYRRFGRMPSQEAMLDNSVHLPDVVDPVDYYMQRCQNRAMYNVVSANFQELNTALRNVQMSEVLRLMRLTISQATSLSSTRDLSTIELEANDFLGAYEEDKYLTGLKGITTGYAPVDEHTNGLQPGDVGILVGRPNMGKTYLFLHMVISAWLSGKSILVVSMEMSTQQLVRRIVAIMAGIDPYFIHRGRLSYHAETHMRDVIRGFGDLPPIHFVAGNFRKTISDIDNYVLEVMPDAIYIDGGYLVGSGRSSKGAARHEKLTEVIEDMKAMATDRQRPVVTTVQFNREVRKNTKTSMDLAQIAGSDAVGQIASLVMGIQQGPAGNRTGQRVVEVLKNREGELLKFLTNFKFSPPDFGYAGMYTDEGEVQEEQAAAHSSELRQSMI